jgi:8-oxo-dGTP pyrophosphatase MutT (NUDIX family)
LARVTRYQGAIVRNDRILLLLQELVESGETYWLIPGGGILEGETEFECVKREMKEETHLDVKVIGLLLDEPSHNEGAYRRMKTYLCEPIGGKEKPGSEPEPEVASLYSIVAVGWFDLRDETQWEMKLMEDPFTYPLLRKIREALGYMDHE